MQQEADNKYGDSAEKSEFTISSIVAVCSEQLRLAIDDSRAEMDGLTLAVLSGDLQDSSDLIARLQSVDRLMQRLGNVKSNLDHVAEYLNQEEISLPGSSLARLSSALRATFTMSAEREIFDEMIGQSDESANCPEDDVVLF